MPLPRRRSRLLLLSVACMALLIGGSWLVAKLQRVSRQREAVSALRALGGIVTYDYQLDPSFRRAKTYRKLMEACDRVTDRRDLPDPDHDGRAWLRRLVGPDLFHDVISVNMVYSHDVNGGNRAEPEHVFNEDLLLLSRFPRLRVLFLQGDQACDRVLEAMSELRDLEVILMWDAGVSQAGVENLRGLKKLRYLHISNAGLDDRSLEVFGQLTELEGLSLQGNRFTDEGLAQLRKLTKLQSLWLCSIKEKGDSRIRGPGLARLSGLTELRELGLQHTGFSDEGVPYLQPFTKLEHLYLGRTELTAEGEAGLRKMHPDCAVDVHHPAGQSGGAGR